MAYAYEDKMKGHVCTENKEAHADYPYYTNNVGIDTAPSVGNLATSNAYTIIRRVVSD